MLVLTVQPGEVFWVGDVAVKVHRHRAKGEFRVAFDGPREVPIDRNRVRQAKLKGPQTCQG